MGKKETTSKTSEINNIDKKNNNSSGESTDSAQFNKVRIESIDMLKGIAIILVVLGHITRISLQDWAIFIFWVIYMVLDVFGPSLFVFLTVLSTSFSINMKKGKMEEKEIRDMIIGRAIPLWIIGVFQNFLMENDMGLLKFWSWGIFFFIAIAQVTTYYAVKIKQKYRIIALFCILIVYEISWYLVRSGMNNAGMDYKNFEFSHLSNPFGFLYFLIFNPMNGEPFLPWIIIPFAVAGVGENLSKMVKDGSKDKYIEFNKKVFKDGLLLISVGIILGLRYTTDDLGWGLIDGFNNSINILFTDIVGISSQGDLSVPEFLIHSTTANMFYNLGVGYLLLALCFYICEIKGHKGKIVKFLSFYGKVSLSIYILHILLGGIFLGKLIFDVFIYVAFIIFALYYIMKVWAYKFDMKFTPEFFIIAFGTAYVNKKKAIREKISKKIEKPST